jgi:hypothetical protein
VTDCDEGGGSGEELVPGASVITQALMKPPAPVNMLYDRWVRCLAPSVLWNPNPRNRNLLKSRNRNELRFRNRNYVKTDVFHYHNENFCNKIVLNS